MKQLHGSIMCVQCKSYNDSSAALGVLSTCTQRRKPQGTRPPQNLEWGDGSANRPPIFDIFPRYLKQL